mgnify:CR=1 FL=1
MGENGLCGTKEDGSGDKLMAKLDVGMRPQVAIHGLLRALRSTQIPTDQQYTLATEMGKRMPPGWRARWATRLPELQATVNTSEGAEIVRDFLCRTNGRCAKCLTQARAQCTECGIPQCVQCRGAVCDVCSTAVGTMQTPKSTAHTAIKSIGTTDTRQGQGDHHAPPEQHQQQPARSTTLL